VLIQNPTFIPRAFDFSESDFQEWTLFPQLLPGLMERQKHEARSIIAAESYGADRLR
jgi:hypothetical protein